MKGIAESKTLFEAPILSNNSIIRLKSPSVKIHLSNEDMRSLTDEIMDDLLFVLYELCSSAIEDKILRKLRVGTFVEFSSVLQIFKDAFGIDLGSEGPNESTVGLNSHITTLHRIGKKKYKLHYSKNWELEIIIDNIEKLAHWRKLLTLLDSMALSSNETENIPLFIPSKSTNVLIRRIISDQPQQGENECDILVESDDNELDIVMSENLASRENSTYKDVKPEISFQYKGMRLFDKCLRVNVLKRPKRP